MVEKSYKIPKLIVAKQYAPERMGFQDILFQSEIIHLDKTYIYSYYG